MKKYVLFVQPLQTRVVAVGMSLLCGLFSVAAILQKGLVDFGFGSLLLIGFAVFFCDPLSYYICLNTDAEELIIRTGLLPKDNIVLNTSAIKKIHFTEGDSNSYVSRCDFTLNIVYENSIQSISVGFRRYPRRAVSEQFYLSQKHRYCEFEKLCNDVLGKRGVL